uniref:proline-rich protein 5 isoform X2 n=1 Tax=Myxine glutinosa TaxID=7769 RepID=UPI00358E4E6A
MMAQRSRPTAAKLARTVRSRWIARGLRAKHASSPNLREMGRLDGEDKAVMGHGHQQQTGATWDSVQNAVVGVFLRKGLKDNELHMLNETMRHMLKSDMGPLINDYIQTRLLTKGMIILREKMHFYEGQKLLDTLAGIWEYFFGEILPMLQAIFHPVQGKELSVRQMALLAFRDIITLKVKLLEALAKRHARVPPNLIQMLLVMQSVHEPTGPTPAYLQLESILKEVVSPYMGTEGLLTDDETSSHNVCILERSYRLHPLSLSSDRPGPTWLLTSPTSPLSPKEQQFQFKLRAEHCLAPVVELDVDASPHNKVQSGSNSAPGPLLEKAASECQATSETQSELYIGEDLSLECYGSGEESDEAKHRNDLTSHQTFAPRVSPDDDSVPTSPGHDSEMDSSDLDLAGLQITLKAPESFSHNSLDKQKKDPSSEQAMYRCVQQHSDSIPDCTNEDSDPGIVTDFRQDLMNSTDI